MRRKQAKSVEKLCTVQISLELGLMEDYVVLGRVGEGAHGIVMKGRHKKSGSIVALKKVLIKRLEDGIPETALREIKALQVGLFACRL